MSCRKGNRVVPSFVAVWLCLSSGSFGEPTCVLHLSMDGQESVRAVGGDVRGGSWEPGRRGRAWRSQGGDDRIVIPDGGRLVRASGTIEMLFRVEPGQAEDGGVVLFDCLGKPNWWNRYCGSIRWHEGVPSAAFTIVANKSVQFACDCKIASPCDVRPGSWHHYAATWQGVGSGADDAEMRLFIDGVEIARLDGQSIPVTSMGKSLWLGNALHKPARAKVPAAILLDDVRVWDAVLPAHELARRAHAASGVEPEPAPWSSVSSLAVRPAVEPPTIDGKADEKAWQFAQCVTGFRDYHKASGPLVPLQTTAWLAYDPQNLYVAWRCDMAGARPRGESRPRDAPVFNDESVEVLFSSPAAPDTLFHFIGNAYGSVYDEMLIAGGRRDRAWSGPWEYSVNVVPARYWEGELRIPLHELGLSSPTIGEAWRLNVARNGFEPQYQSIWSHTTKAYADRDALAVMTIAGPGPVVSAMVFPELVVGENRLDLRYASTSDEPGPLAVLCTAETDGGESMGTAWRRRPDASTARTDAARLAAPREGLNRITVRVVDETDDMVLLQQPMEVTARPPLSVTVKSEFPDGYIVVGIDARAMAGGGFSATADLRVRDGRTLRSANVAAFVQAATVRLSLDGVPKGEYRIAATVKDVTGKVTERSIPFTLQAEPDCVSDTAGRGGVMPPWTPLRVEGKTVYCGDRGYTFADGPFPASLVAGGGEVFTEQPRFVWRVGTRSGELRTGTFAITASSGDAVEFAGRLEDELFRVDYTGVVEFDGAVLYDLVVVPRQDLPTVDDFALELRLRPEAARFFLEGHAEHVREERNVLPSEPGKRVCTKFLPMAALCGEERGLQWFCESDEGWTPYDRRDTMVMERQGNAMLWRFTIKQGGSFEAPLRMNCGFVATPVKPLARNRDSTRVVHFWPGGPVRSTPEAFYRPHVLKEVAKYGGKVITLHSYWADVFGSVRPYDVEKFTSFVEEAHRLGIRVTVYMSGLGHPDYPDALYYGDRWPQDPRAGFKSRTWERKEVDSIVRCAGSQSFRDWLCGGVERLLRETGVDGLYYDWGCSACRNGKHGCGYLPEGGSSLDVPEAGEEELILGVAVQSLAGPWSKYRRTTPVRAQRELWKRLYRIVKEVRGPAGSVIAHSDVPSHLVYTAFTDGIWHSEDVACHMPRDWIPEPWYYRIFMSKQHLGMLSELLTMVDHDSGPWRSQEKGIAMALVHNEWPRPRTTGLWGTLPAEHTQPVADVWRALDAFGTDGDDVQWCPYWKNGGWIESGQDRVLVSCWRKPRLALFCVANWTNEEKRVEVRIKDEMLGTGHATDAISGEAVAFRAGCLTLALEPAHMRLVVVGPE